MHQRSGPDGQTALASLARASVEVTTALEAGGLWQLSDRRLVSGLDAAYRLVAQTHALALAMVAELDARDLGVEAGATSTAAWLASTRRMRPQEAKRDVSLARLLRRAGDDRTTPSDADEPGEGSAVRMGLALGELNVDQAGVVARALEELPDDAATSTRVLAERLLVDEASMHGPAALTQLGHRIAERVDPDAADRKIAEQLEREEREARRLRSGTRFADGHGSVCYRFRVPVSDDALIWPVLDALAAPEPAGDGINDTDTRAPHQRFADAFVEAMRRVGLDESLPAKGGDRPRALIALGLESLRTGLGCGTMIDTGDLLGPSAIRRLCCDAQVIPQVLGGDSQLLDQGRAARTATGPLRLAVTSRDRGCIHPGCPRPPRWADVHHVIAWWRGGATSLGNCVLLCGYHHRLYDAGDWAIRFAADGIPECIPPPWVDRERRPRRHERYLERAPGLP